MSEILTQSQANQILWPCCVGWSIQLALCGGATIQGLSLLTSRQIVFKRTGLYLLIAALLTNIASTAVNFAELGFYLTLQDRSADSLNSYILADAVSSLTIQTPVAICQAFFAIRCYAITGRKNWIAGLIGGLVLIAWGASIWTTVDAVLYWRGQDQRRLIFISTEVTLWSQLSADIMITSITSYRFAKLRKGFNLDTDYLLNSLMRLSLQTAFFPCLFTAITAVIYCATYETDYLWNMFNATLPFIPSLYVFSFIYLLNGQSRRKEEHHRRSRSGAATPAPNVKTANSKGDPISSLDARSWGEADPWLTQSRSHSSGNGDVENGGTPVVPVESGIKQMQQARPLLTTRLSWQDGYGGRTYQPVGVSMARTQEETDETDNSTKE